MVKPPHHIHTYTHLIPSLLPYVSIICQCCQFSRWKRPKCIASVIIVPPPLTIGRNIPMIVIFIVAFMGMVGGQCHGKQPSGAAHHPIVQDRWVLLWGTRWNMPKHVYTIIHAHIYMNTPTHTATFVISLASNTLPLTTPLFTAPDVVGRAVAPSLRGARLPLGTASSKGAPGGWLVLLAAGPPVWVVRLVGWYCCGTSAASAETGRMRLYMTHEVATLSRASGGWNVAEGRWEIVGGLLGFIKSCRVDFGGCLV